MSSIYAMYNILIFFSFKFKINCHFKDQKFSLLSPFKGTPSINGDESHSKHNRAVVPENSKHLANGSRNNGAIPNEYRNSKRFENGRSSRRGGRRGIPIFL